MCVTFSDFSLGSSLHQFKVETYFKKAKSQKVLHTILNRGSWYGESSAVYLKQRVSFSCISRISPLTELYDWAIWGGSDGGEGEIDPPPMKNTFN